MLEHLEQQLESARRLLRVVLAQGEAIRRQDVEAVLVQLGEVREEMGTRRRLELERDAILGEAAAKLGVPLETVDLDALLALLSTHEAARTRMLSAELRGLFVEIARVHGQNRVLIRQELAFLDHLIRLLSDTPQGTYSPLGELAFAPTGVRVVDARV